MAVDRGLLSSLARLTTPPTPPTPTRKTARSISGRAKTSLAESLRPPSYSSIGGLEGLSGAESPFGPKMLDFVNVQLGVAESMYPGQGFLPTADQDYSYMGAQIEASIDPAIEYAEQFGLQDILGYPQAGGVGDGFGGGGGGGGAAAPPQPTPITWSVGNYKAFGPNIPTWWKPMVPHGTAANERPDVQFSLMMNAMIPYVSPEDQVTVARKLYETWGDQFGVYKGVGIKGTRVRGGKESAGRAPISREQQQRGIEGQLANEQFFRGPQRADFARQTLESIRQNVTKDIGAGGRFMEDILSAISQTGGGRTRASTAEMLGQIDPMLAGAQAGALAPFGPLGKMTAAPFFSKFQQQPVQRTETGGFIFGKPSKLLQF